MSVTPLRCSVYVATSVDGFIAGPKGEIDWLHAPELAGPISGLSYEEFISTVDAVVMGRHTFETVLTFGSWPYDRTEVVVLTSRNLDLPDHLAGKARVESGSPATIAGRLAEEGMKHLYVDGGITVQRFLDAGLIDEITITRIPVILGSGIPLFGDFDRTWRLQLIESAVSRSGIVQDRYRVLHDGAEGDQSHAPARSG